MPIRVLTPHEAARIAAGEVIERPASVAKELIENALDAGARQIAVETRQGGIAFLRVTDDGEGLPPDELRLAFERHATSKLQSEEELWRIATLGFRGEALPSIAAAADVELISRPAGALVAGRIILKDGEVQRQGSAGAPPGTQVTVQGLFRRQPARLKFLRSSSAEGGQIATVVTQCALAYPDVRFTLRADGRTVLQTPGNGDLRDAAAAAYGVELAAELLPLDSEPYGEIEVLGLAGSPAVSRANRSYISLFVNRRCIRNRSLTFAVVEAYQGMLPVGRFPVAIVGVRLPPDQIDVNVHPTKAEVRFRDERAVFAAVQRTVRRTISARSPVPDLDAGGSIFDGQGAADTLAPGTIAAPALNATLVHPHPRPTTTTHDPQPSDPQPELIAQLPVLRAVGQVSNTYVVAEGPDGLYLVDQHAAHERVLYERFLAAQREGVGEVQPLLQPATLELSASQRSLLETFAGELAAAGLSVEEFGEGAHLVRAVPPSLAGRDVSRAVGELLDLLAREDGPTEEPAHRVAASLACHAAVRAGHTMSEEEQRELITQLESTEQPRTCPHGRPTMIHLSADTLARQFRRR
ncbi:MAG: DNA mismatch repair endonuclease MutL [Chloroflexi bacterium]|nr:DNA mismatch repair endonuclease MutL [Chloroflexota bacterium]